MTPRHPARAGNAFTTLFDAVAAAGAPARIELLLVLADGPKRPADLVAHARIEPSSVSQHLHQLLDLGLVAFEQKGRERLYSLGPALTVSRRNGRVTELHLHCDDGSSLVLRLGDDLLHRLSPTLAAPPHIVTLPPQRPAINPS